MTLSTAKRISVIERTPAGLPAFAYSVSQPLLLIALYTLSLLILGSALLVQFGFPLDDSYIHQTVARNLAHYGIPGFIPGVRSSGATSLVWTYLQAFNDVVLHLHPVIYNLLFSWLLLCLIGPLLFALARRDGLSARVCWLLAAAPALCGNFIWYGLIGMEHLLFVTVSLLAIYFWFDPVRNRRRSAIYTGIAAGFLCITRPEAVVFGPLLLIAAWLLARIAKLPPVDRRSTGESGIVLGIWAAFVALMFSANLYTSHALMPATLKGRTWLYFHTSGGPHTPATVSRFIGAWIMRLPRQFSTHYIQQMRTLSEVHGSFAIFGLSLAALALLGGLVLLSARPLRVTCVVLWAVAHFCIYMATFPTGGHGGRYQPFTLLLFFPFVCFGLLWLFSLATPRTTIARWPAYAVLILLLAGGAASLRTWRTVSIDGIQHINSTHAMIAKWLLANAPPDATIAVFDIGRISYDWGRGIIDLGGLVDPTYYHYLVDGQVPAYLKLKHAQYLVLPSAGTDGFGFPDPSLGMTKVAEYCSPKDIWEIGFRYTIHATQCQELYRLNLASSPVATP